MDAPRRARVDSALPVLLTLAAGQANGAAGTIYREVLLTECTKASYVVAAGTGRVTVVAMADAATS